MAETDNYQTLATLKIGDAVATSILSQGEDTGVYEIDNQPTHVYTFPSSEYAYPHIIYLRGNQLVFLQLTLPAEFRAQVAQEQQALGTPEITDNSSSSEITYAYPGYGVTYVVNSYTNTIDRVQYYPAETEVEYVQKQELVATSSELPKLIVSPSTSTSKQTSLPFVLLLIFLVVAAVALFVGIIIHRRRQTPPLLE